MERALAEPYVAVAAFTSTLGKNGDDEAARKGRTGAYLINRQFREAENDLLYLEQIQGKTGFSRFHLGVIAFQTAQDIDRAHELIDSAIELEKSSFRRKYYYFQRAEFYRQRGRQPEAIADYSAAIDEDILFEEAYFGRAQSRHAVGDLEGGLADLVIIKSSIKGRMAAKARALINAYLRKPAAGGASTRSAGPETASLSNGRPARSPEQDREAGLKNDYREFLIRGLRLYFEEDIEAARRDFYRVISYEPDNAKAYFMLGEIAARHDSSQVEACLFFRKAHRLAPDTPDYLIELSRCLYRQRNYSAVIDLLSTFIDTPEPPDISEALLAQLFFLRGSCLEKSGLGPEALEDMRQALALDPGHEAAAEFIENQPVEHPSRK
jgi:tetratricopeptide (TPR) repeat protein